MAHFYRGAVPLHRFLRGLLLAALPRAWISPAPSPSSVRAAFRSRSLIQFDRGRPSWSAALW